MSRNSIVVLVCAISLVAWGLGAVGRPGEIPFEKHTLRTINFTENYIDNFSDLPVDVNADGNIDIVSCSYFSKRMVWMENPGSPGGDWRGEPDPTQWCVGF